MMLTCRLPTERTARSSGFTLIEMLVVLTIMGLVAAVAIAVRPQGQGFVAREKVAARVAQAINDARSNAGRSGRVAEVDLETMTSPGQVLTVEPLLPNDQQNKVYVYSDGSTSGGTISLNDSPMLELDWLTGALHDAKR